MHGNRQDMAGQSGALGLAALAAAHQDPPAARRRGGLQVAECIADHHRVFRRHPKARHGIKQHAGRRLAPRAGAAGRIGAMEDGVEPGPGPGELALQLVMDQHQHRLVDDPAAHHRLVGANGDEPVGGIEAGDGLGRTRQHDEFARRLH